MTSSTLSAAVDLLPVNMTLCVTWAVCCHRRHSQGQLLVISKRQPGQQLPEQYVLPKPAKQQLENAVRKVQEQLHAQGLSVTLGSLDCALAQAFGLTGSLSDLGYQPRDLAPIQVSRLTSSCYLHTRPAG